MNSYEHRICCIVDDGLLGHLPAGPGGISHRRPVTSSSCFGPGVYVSSLSPGRSVYDSTAKLATTHLWTTLKQEWHQ